MVKARNRIRIRSVGRQSKQLAKMHSKLSMQIKKLETKIEADGQKNKTDLESTIQRLEKKLDEEKREQTMLKGKKEFVLKLELDASTILDLHREDEVKSEEEEHFGLNWHILMKRTEDVYSNGEKLVLNLECEAEGDQYYVEVEEITTIRSDGRIGGAETHTHIYHNINHDELSGFIMHIPWENVEKAFSGLSTVTIGIRVTVMLAEGEWNRSREEYAAPIPNLTDVALKVNGRLFHVSRQLLANHSTYFENLFYKEYSEAGKSAVPLFLVDPCDFRFFLDVLYGKLTMDDKAVEGVLVIANMYSVEFCILQCQQFLMYKSQKSQAKKFSMAVEYKMNDLALDCIAKIENMKEFEMMTKKHLQKLEKPLYIALLEKSMELKR